MAKPGLSNVTTAQTFQTWLDRTNQIVDIMKSDVITASFLGDTTNGNATLVGSFNATTLVASDRLRTDIISPKTGSTSTVFTNPIDVQNASAQNALTLSSPSGPRALYNAVTGAGGIIWQTGFQDVVSNNFIIRAGSGGTPQFSISTTGNMTISGTINTTGGGTVTANLIGNVTGNLVGNVTGTVSSISNHTTNALAEGTNLYFTVARVRDSINAGTGVTYDPETGIISIGQAVGIGNNVQFANLITTGTITSTGAISSNGDITAFASSSDIRKKENIVRIDNALQKVLQIGGYTYNFKNDDRKLAGVIAQELEQVLPEVVYEIDDDEFGKSKAVRYGNIVGLLIEAIKELKSELDDIKSKIE